MTITAFKPYEMLTERQLRKAYNKLWAKVQKLEQGSYPNMARTPRDEMQRIVEEFERRSRQKGAE